ncbi:SDR family NAD(P)-dependent oxidoreductase [Thetidibacter halocola]|uniref:SDR family oxidoreductase n=1 Tax=Thetidibacter halocola TaxID=2827239 RepID=A0A8J7WCF7_9RHOB|nr:SDR family oxidoreductase [Thetidibacter halocola]MBS0125015.1 SDR family oxidoreductase [Thetidibacter halocola]
MNLEYENRRVLVVGGSYGIGLASAKLAAAEGATVAIASRSAGNLETAAAEIEAETGQKPLTLVADVTKDGASQALADQIKQHWGELDVLISAVGGSIRSSFADLTDEQWMDNYNFNVLSTVRTIRACLPLLERGTAPAIVLLGAAASKMPYAHQIVSNVHKAGLLGLNKTLAAELAPDGIRVNLVAPGRTLTPLWTNRADKLAAEEHRSREDILADFSKDIPLGRFGKAVEVARMVVWLASPCASYVTGQAVNVDGGIARGLL